MGDFERLISALLTAVIGVAIVSVIVSKNSQTSSVLTSAGNAFSGILKVAVSPVTGGAQVAVQPA